MNALTLVMASCVTFLIGASGAGKSVLSRELARMHPAVVCLHFDELIGELGLWVAGQAEAWQRRATLEWCRRIAQLPAAHVLLEGQTRHCFAREACGVAGIGSWQMILVHCDAEVRAARVHARGEPELDSPEMRSWADWLLHDAGARNLPVVDTTRQSIEAAGQQLAVLMGLHSAR